MSQQNTNTDNYRDDEIDLRKLFQAIGNGFANIGNGFVNLIIRFRRVSLNYKFVLIAMILIGAIAGITLNKVSKPYYKTSMLISSSYFNTRLIENTFDKLNTLCEEEERSGLGKLLDIDVNVAENIREFDFEPLVTEQDQIDMEILKQKLADLAVEEKDIQKVINQLFVQNKRAYIFSVDVYDNTIIESLQGSLVGYLKNNPYVKNRIEINKKNNLKLIEKLKVDIKQLDSLKQLFNLNMKANADRKGESSTSNVYVGESGTLNPSGFYSQSIALYKELQATERSIVLESDFEVRDSFTVFTVPESPSLLKATVYSIVIFFGLGYLLIIFIEINKYLSRVEKERFTELNA